MAFGEPIVLHSRTVTGQDIYHSDVYSSTDTATSGAFAPAGSTEVVQGQDTITTQDSVYITDLTGLPAVEAIDQLTVRGVTYDVDGTPALWVNPWSGETDGLVIRLRGVTG